MSAGTADATLLDRDRHREGLGFAGADLVEADIVFGGVGWPHPGFDAEEGRVVGFGPGYEGVSGIWGRLGADFDFETRVVLLADAFHEGIRKLVVDTVDDAGIGD